MSTNIKFSQALTNLYNPVPEYVFSGTMDSEEKFNSVKWKTEEASNGEAILNDTPPSGVNWSAVKTEMDKL
jgi:hypothetical protein|tara:strand:+ start:911 stop:1123 length:213 start_codon:yes stop_codon:yes gene_type:complete